MVLGETFENDQKPNLKLVISRPESDSLVTQLDIWRFKGGPFYTSLTPLPPRGPSLGDGEGL